MGSQTHAAAQDLMLSWKTWIQVTIFGDSAAKERKTIVSKSLTSEILPG